MKTIALSILLAVCLNIDAKYIPINNSNLSIDPTLNKLEKRIAVIDTYIKGHSKEVILLAKVTGKKDLVLVKNNNKWPDDTEYSYNVLKDATGKIIYVMGSPISESGDWDIMYLYYFDNNGKIFAFKRETGFFNSMCTDDAAHELIVEYFNSDFKLLSQTYKLTDSKGKALQRSKCEFPYDFHDYKIYPNVKACLKDYHIKLF